MTAAEVLRAAADVIEERGWTRGVFECDGRVSVLGALRVVCFGSPDAFTLAMSSAGEYLSVHSRLLAHLGVLSLYEWNDQQPSQQHVVAALREAAAAVEAS